MVGRDGFEPSTKWLKATCSTAELTARRDVPQKDLQRGAHYRHLGSDDNGVQRYAVGSATRAASKPSRRNRQLSHRPQACPSTVA